MVVSIGIPLDENSSFLKGTANAPEAIRRAMSSPSANSFSESGVDISGKWNDLGDLSLPPMPEAFPAITRAVADILAQENRLVTLGGDHSITFPVIEAFAAKYPDLNILHIDAHADLYDEFEGSRHSHACPFARIMEKGLAKRLVQIGIRTLTTHQREQASRFGVETIEMKDWNDNHVFNFHGPLYISLDLDALDPAFAPGISHHEPGGFSTRQVINVIRKIDATIVGTDIVELNPVRDVHGMTAMVAAKLMKEIVAKMQ